MNDSTRDDIAGQIAQVAERLMADLQSSAPSVPPEVVLAYQDGQVQERILDRLAGGGKLRRVEPLIPDIVLRVRRAFFEFEDQSQLPHATVTGFLVMMDDSNEVTEIIDPFELTKLWLSAVTADNVLTLSSIAQPEMRPAEDTGAFQAFAEREGMSAVFQRFNDQLRR